MSKNGRICANSVHSSIVPVRKDKFLFKQSFGDKMNASYSLLVSLVLLFLFVVMPVTPARSDEPTAKQTVEWIKNALRAMNFEHEFLINDIVIIKYSNYRVRKVEYSNSTKLLSILYEYRTTNFHYDGSFDNISDDDQVIEIEMSKVSRFVLDEEEEYDNRPNLKFRYEYKNGKTRSFLCCFGTDQEEFAGRVARAIMHLAKLSGGGKSLF